MLVSLSIDRYDAITHPLNLSGCWRRARLSVASAWGLSIIFSVPAVFLNEETMVKGHPQCWINLDPWQWQVYISLVALSLFFIPAIIISACYSIIVYTIWHKSRLMDFPKASNKSHRRNKKNRCSASSTTATTTFNEGKRISVVCQSEDTHSLLFTFSHLTSRDIRSFTRLQLSCNCIATPFYLLCTR